MNMTIKQRLARWYARAVTGGALAVIASSTARAEGEPLDLDATGTTIAGYVAGAAAAGVGVLAAIWGVRVIIKAFKAVAK